MGAPRRRAGGQRRRILSRRARLHDRAVSLKDIGVIRSLHAEAAWGAGVAGRHIDLAQDCHRKTIGWIPPSDLHHADLSAGGIHQADKSKAYCDTF